MDMENSRNDGDRRRDGDQNEEVVVTTTEIRVVGRQAVLRDRVPGAVLFRIGFPLPRRKVRDEEIDRQDRIDALNAARSAYRLLTGKTASEDNREFVQEQERADLIEARHQKEMEDLGREKYRAIADSGVPVFRDFFPNGFTDTSWKPFVEGVEAREFVLANLYVKVMSDGDVFIYVLFRHPKHGPYEEFSAETIARVMSLLQDHTYAWTNVFDNRDTPGGLITVNGPMPKSFWKDEEGRAKEQGPRHRMVFTRIVGLDATAQSTWQIAVEPDLRFVERRMVGQIKADQRRREERQHGNRDHRPGSRRDREIAEANRRDRHRDARW